MRRFIAIAYNEVLLNSKRVAPYVIALLCAGNGLLWWAKGPATGRDWATNADFFIAGTLPPYSFLFLPLYTALMMADPVTRDFRAGIDPLLFSTPLTRAQYLLGKFCGSFFVLVCCQFAFSVMFFVLQWLPKQGMVVQEKKFFLYPKHFVFFVVISHLFLGAIYFTVGALTRSTKIVYGLGVAFYPLYIAYQSAVLKSLPAGLRVVLDPLVMNRGNVWSYQLSAAELNRLVVVYDSNLIINRAAIIMLAAICLTILCRRFTIAEREREQKFSVLNISAAAERVYYPESSAETLPDEFQTDTRVARFTIPDVVRANAGFRAGARKLIDATGLELQLLRAERSLVVVIPLAVFVSILEVAFYNIPADVSYSAASATNTANLLLLFLIGVAVFYSGEAMHRDREIRIEPFLWSTPVSNSVLILSKFLSTLLLLIALIVSVGLAAVAIQVVRHHTPIELGAYLKVYGLILFPSAFILTSISVAANVVLRNKYVFYVVSIGAAAGLFYLYTNGHNHWLYNPTLYRLWSYVDLSNSTRTFLLYRVYWLVIAAACLALAHLFFERRSRRKAHLPLPFALG